MSNLVRHLTIEAEYIGRFNRHYDGHRYQSLAACVLTHGRTFSEIIEPPWRGQMKQCFNNAFTLADQRPDLRYCEGYAYSTLIPVLHAWCIDAEDRVLDPTWTDGAEYHGIAFDTEWVRRHLLRTKYWGVLGGDYEALSELMRDGIPPEALAQEVSRG